MTGMIDVARLREFATEYTAAWCSRNAASVAAYFAPDGSLTINDDVPSAGRGAIAEAAHRFMATFPDLEVVMDGLVVKDELAENHWTLTGTNNGPGGTRKRVRVRGFEVWKIGDDGLIAESRGRFDAAEYRRQLEFGGDELE